MNTALGSCTRLVLAHGSTWLNRCSGCSSAERWRDTMSMMWRSSKTGFATPSRDGIGIGPPLSGEASDTHAVTGPMRAVIGREAQELPPSMCCRDAFAPCAITDGSAMPLQMATDPLGGLSRELHFDGELTLHARVVFLLLLHDLSQGEHERLPGSIHLKLPDVFPPGHFHQCRHMLRVALRCHAMRPHQQFLGRCAEQVNCRRAQAGKFRNGTTGSLVHTLSIGIAQPHPGLCCRPATVRHGKCTTTFRASILPYLDHQAATTSALSPHQ